MNPIAEAESHIHTKPDKYAFILKQFEPLIDAEIGIVGNMANLTALIQSVFSFHWTGFYLVKGEKLILGPFQGPVACTQIPKGKGVCGKAWSEGKTLIVPDVHQFPGHIACSALSNSEIVVPLFNNQGDVMAVLDIDSTDFSAFDEIDAEGLERLVTLLK